MTIGGPRSAWRKDVVPGPRERASREDRTENEPRDPARPERVASTAAHAQVTGPSRGDVALLAPNVLSVRHWDRLMQGALYAATPRVDWASLLRRSFDVDVLQCPRCQGRLRVLAVITERDAVQRILAHLGVPTDPPPLARARDPTDDAEPAEQLQVAPA